MVVVESLLPSESLQFSLHPGLRWQLSYDMIPFDEQSSSCHPFSSPFVNIKFNEIDTRRSTETESCNSIACNQETGKKTLFLFWLRRRDLIWMGKKLMGKPDAFWGGRGCLWWNVLFHKVGLLSLLFNSEFNTFVDSWTQWLLPKSLLDSKPTEKATVSCIFLELTTTCYNSARDSRFSIPQF